MTDSDPSKEKREMFGDNDKRSGVMAWGRRVLIGLLALVVTILLLWFVLITPQNNQIRQLQADLLASQNQVATLEANVAALESVKPQREILSLLVDANTARFELARFRTADAAAALLNAERTLVLLSTELGADFDETISTLQERLELAKEEIGSSDRLSALSDLEVFVNILLQLQRSLLTP